MVQCLKSVCIFITIKCRCGIFIMCSEFIYDLSKFSIHIMSAVMKSLRHLVWFFNMSFLSCQWVPETRFLIFTVPAPNEIGMPWSRPHAGGAEDMDNIDDHHYEGSLFPTSTLIPVTVICILIFIVGVTGNTMTILIIQRFKDMKTTTNLYLSSMAVSDLIIFLCLPFDLYRLWKYVPWLFGEVVCRLYHYIFEGCTSATILHITALSVERYLAISFPLRSKAVVTRRRVQYIIFALWGFALVSAAPMLFLVGVEYDNETHPDYNTGQCKHTNYAIISGKLHIMLWVSTTYFFCPMLCLIFLYGSIGCKLWKSKNDLQGPCALARERPHRQTVKILGE